MVEERVQTIRAALDAAFDYAEESEYQYMLPYELRTPALRALDALWGNMNQLRDFVARYRHYHDGLAECESAGQVETCNCSICDDVRGAATASPAGREGLAQGEES